MYKRLISILRKNKKEKEIYFITYGDKRFRKSKKRLVIQAKLFGFNYIKPFGFNDLPIGFVLKTEPFIRNERGGGYWLWKPYILFKTFDKMNYGDILLYLDAGFELNIKGEKRFWEYMNIMDSNNGVLSFYLPGMEEKRYTNDKVFEFFEITTEDVIYNSFQMVGGCFLLRKNTLTENLVKDFFDVSVKRPDLFSDVYNEQTTRKNFIDHRHDQSIFSILRKKYGFFAIQDETYSNDFGLMLNYPFLAKRIKDKKSFFYRFVNKVKYVLKSLFINSKRV